jgi:hypothetical protein
MTIKRPHRGSDFARLLVVAGALIAVVGASADAQSNPVKPQVANSGDASFGNPNYVAVLVRITLPAGVTHEQVIGAMRKSIPEYQALPGLVRKYYTISDDNRVGGVYLFVNRAAAEAHFNAAWIAGVQKAYGSPPDVIYLSSPIQIDGKG